MMFGLSFTAPWLLAGLASLPVLYWLLRATPPAPQRTPFGGTVFLEQLRDRQETPATTPWWLLLIRLLTVGLLILGLSGPVYGVSNDLSGDGPVLVVVDDSWPAAPRWQDRQAAFAQLALAPGAADRPARILTTAGKPEISDPMTLREASRMISGLIPKAALPDRAETMDLIERAGPVGDLVWLSDGVIGRTGADRSFLRLVGRTDSPIMIRPAGQVTLALTGLETVEGSLTATVDQIGSGVREGRMIAIGSDGRTLGQQAFTFDGAAGAVRVPIDLPLTLRNDIARLTLEGQRSAGATWLTDARARRVRAGIVTEGAQTLLDSGFYLEQALLDHAVIARGTIGELSVAETGVMILDDVGFVRAEDEFALTQWVQEGGILVRFAGPNTAGSSAATTAVRNETFPVALRGGERAFGGALSWTEPQSVADMPDDGPFAGLALSSPIEVRRQVLTRGGAEPGYEIWATLTDGTPLVTARPLGRGQLILFHVTASPTWSDLPVSGIFPDLMGRLAQMSAGTVRKAPTETLAPYRLLDGFGGLRDAPPGASAVKPEDIARGSASPGLYGAPASAIAVNTYAGAVPTLDPLTSEVLPPNMAIRGRMEETVAAFGPSLLAFALLFAAMDALALLLRQRRQDPSTSPTEKASRKPVAAAILAVCLGLSFMPSDASAQPANLRPEIDPRAQSAALSVRFAYVVTGDADVDRVTRAGLDGLAREATRRSALEPAPPVGIDLERDDLSVFPLVYWPIIAGVPAPSDGALAQLETFMADGGLLIIDTRDGERQTAAADTPEAETLKRILLRMNVPPLEPMPPEHILTKSFYRLQDLHGRNTGGSVWVEATTALRESTDGVPSIIISGRDWAAAWAVDASGRPLRAAGRGGEVRREYAFRSGINMAMVALTGSYKEDQVHVQAVLDRLGESP